jgi:hypothetical protein
MINKVNSRWPLSTILECAFRQLTNFKSIIQKSEKVPAKFQLFISDRSRVIECNVFLEKSRWRQAAILI